MSTREQTRVRWIVACITITSILALATSGCAPGDVAEQEDLPPVPVDAEDHLPDDIYSVKQESQAFFDSVLAERTTLIETVADRRPAIDAYIAGEDGRGARFAADGWVQTQLEDCLLRTRRFAEETLPQTSELMRALDRDQVGLERFKLRFQRFDDAWVDTNRCWLDVWADSTFDAWLPRHAAQLDSVADEAQARRVSAAAARRAEAERQRAQRIAEQEERNRRADSIFQVNQAERAARQAERAAQAKERAAEADRHRKRQACLNRQRARFQVRRNARTDVWQLVEYDYVEGRAASGRQTWSLGGEPRVLINLRDDGALAELGPDAPAWVDATGWTRLGSRPISTMRGKSALTARALEQWRAVHGASCEPETDR